jgi:hypothetical protein
VSSALLIQPRTATARGQLFQKGLGPADDADPVVDPGTLPAGTGALVRVDRTGSCAFYDRRTGLCAVHERLGSDSLPASCQHFPRGAVIERGRASLTLSHSCPTVARLAFRSDLRPAIVPAPSSLVGQLRLEGLDATNALPPFLSQACSPTWTVTTRGCGSLWRHSPMPPIPSLPSRVARVTTRLQGWRPGAGTVRQWVADLAGEDAAGAGGSSDHLVRDGMMDEPTSSLAAVPAALAYDLVRRAVPAGLAAPDLPADREEIDPRLVARCRPMFARPLSNYLASQVFASWCAYQGQGLLSIVRLLGVSLALMRAEAARQCGRADRPLDASRLVEALRAPDLLLIHLVDPVELARTMSDVESRGTPTRRHAGRSTEEAAPAAPRTESDGCRTPVLGWGTLRGARGPGLAHERRSGRRCGIKTKPRPGFRKFDTAIPGLTGSAPGRRRA